METMYMRQIYTSAFLSAYVLSQDYFNKVTKSWMCNKHLFCHTYFTLKQS